MPRTPSQMDSKMSVEKVTTNLRYLRPDPRPDLDGSGEGDQLEDNNRDAEIVVVGRLLFLLLCLLGEEPIIYRGELQGELDGAAGHRPRSSQQGQGAQGGEKCTF